MKTIASTFRRCSSVGQVLHYDSREVRLHSYFQCQFGISGLLSVTLDGCFFCRFFSLLLAETPLLQILLSFRLLSEEHIQLLDLQTSKTNVNKIKNIGMFSSTS